MRCFILAFVAVAITGNATASELSEAGKTKALLKDLVRIDTSNPPGDTRGIAVYLKTVFDKAGIPNTTIVAPNGKAAHFIARLKGESGTGSILLAAHADVVPAAAADWKSPPFSAEERGGYLYGRGVIDNKGALAVFARTILRLKEERVPLAHDVILLAEADEEQGRYNTTWLAENHWDEIRAAVVLNEGGEVARNQAGQVTNVDITNADKLTLNLKFTARGVSGHSSRPLPIAQTANGRLIDAMQRLIHYRTPLVLSDTVLVRLRGLAANHPGHVATAINAFITSKTDEARDAALDQIAQVEEQLPGLGVQGLLRNTIVVTMLEAGMKANVIPGEATATANCRLLPGTDVHQFIDGLRPIINDPTIRIEIVSPLPADQVEAFYRAKSAIKPSSLDTHFYKALMRSAQTQWPTASVMSTLLVASTDATPWRMRGVPVYGISPFAVDSDSSHRMHGNDERLPLDSIGPANEFVFRAVRDEAIDPGPVQ